MKRDHTILLIGAVLIAGFVIVYFKFMRNRIIVGLAKQEKNAWAGRNENNPAVHSMLVDYWQEGAGFDWINSENINEFDSKYAWSAAFVAFIMRQEYWNFPKSATHANYTVWARDRRQNGKLSMIAMEPNEHKARPGDIIVKGRSYKGDLASLYPTAKTHGDVVIENNGTNIVAIGGNVSNTVRSTTYPATNGYLQTNHFAIIKM